MAALRETIDAADGMPAARLRTGTPAASPTQPPAPMLDTATLAHFTDRLWDDEIVPALERYIEVPAKSPMFDADWAKNGYVDHVVRDAAGWVESKKVAGLKLEVVRIEGRTPVIFFEVPATKAGGRATRSDVRPPRQATRVQRLAQRPRALDAEVSRTACSTAAAAPTTATRSTPRSPRSWRSTRRASRGRAASA